MPGRKRESEVDAELNDRLVAKPGDIVRVVEKLVVGKLLGVINVFIIIVVGEIIEFDVFVAGANGAERSPMRLNDRVAETASTFPQSRRAKPTEDLDVAERRRDRPRRVDAVLEIPENFLGLECLAERIVDLVGADVELVSSLEREPRTQPEGVGSRLLVESSPGRRSGRSPTSLGGKRAETDEEENTRGVSPSAKTTG